LARQYWFSGLFFAATIAGTGCETRQLGRSSSAVSLPPSAGASAVVHTLQQQFLVPDLSEGHLASLTRPKVSFVQPGVADSIDMNGSKRVLRAS
jgi:hypothetical protein